MREQIIEVIQPYIITIVTALIGAVFAFLSYEAKQIKPKLQAWLDARTTASQREALHRIGQEAFAFAETTWKTLDGNAKLDKALTYATRRLKEVGIEMSPEEIEAAVHDAWLKGQQAKTATTVTVVEPAKTENDNLGGV